MNKFNIEEVREMSLKDQIVELENQIQRVKDTREQHAANIRQLEEMTENCNEQLETLIELKWSCKFQQRLEEWMGEPADGYEDWLNGIK
jgi:phage shock protein A